MSASDSLGTALDVTIVLDTVIDLGTASPKQSLFYNSSARFTAFGGARGGGKSHAVRVKAILGAFTYPGISVLIVRRTYPELESSIIAPFLKLLPSSCFSYNSTKHLITFFNGSTVKFGHFSSSFGELEYQGQEFDWIFLDEATQFSERQFRVLGACLRGISPVPKQFFITCNPGGIGHFWVKRLFIDRSFSVDENPEDFLFIPAVVEDNRFLLQSSPDYVKMLDALPDDMRQAHRYGNWDVLSGRFFTEFSHELHLVDDFLPPPSFSLYRSFDYGLDMFACLWIAVSPDGRAFVYREFQRSGLIASEAADFINSLTPLNEKILCTIAPPDIWSTQKDSGRTMAEIFSSRGVPLSRAPSARVQGWMMIKELLSGSLHGTVERFSAVERFGAAVGDAAESGGVGSSGERGEVSGGSVGSGSVGSGSVGSGSVGSGSVGSGGAGEGALSGGKAPLLLICRCCSDLIANIPLLQRDRLNPSDCSVSPHEITHICDALRYFAAFRFTAPASEDDIAFDDSYDGFMRFSWR